MPSLSLNAEEMAENIMNESIYPIGDYIHMTRKQYIHHQDLIPQHKSQALWHESVASVGGGQI